VKYFSNDHKNLLAKLY